MVSTISLKSEVHPVHQLKGPKYEDDDEDPYMVMRISRLPIQWGTGRAFITGYKAAGT
jgi:hypothetical protein